LAVDKYNDVVDVVVMGEMSSCRFDDATDGGNREEDDDDPVTVAVNSMNNDGGTDNVMSPPRIPCLFRIGFVEARRSPVFNWRWRMRI
jgi:hypothetical protein